MPFYREIKDKYNIFKYKIKIHYALKKKPHLLE